MPDCSNPRTRVIDLAEILTNYTDEYNILSAEEILEKLSECGHKITKRCLLSDIKTINGKNKYIIHVSSPKNGYYIAKQYDHKALHIICKAMYSSPIVTQEEAEYINERSLSNSCIETWNLINKTTRNQNFRSTTENISADLVYQLRTAIADKKQVILTVLHIAPGDRFAAAEKEENIIVNPIMLCITNNAFALEFSACTTPSKPQYIRLCRIKDVKLLGSSQNNLYEGKIKNSTGYFDFSAAYATEYKTGWLVMKIRNEDVEYVDNIIELPVQYRKSDEDGYCIAKVQAVFDNRLIGCIFRLKDKIRLLEPQTLEDLI